MTAGTPGHMYFDDKQAKCLETRSNKKYVSKQLKRQWQNLGENHTSWLDKWTPLRNAWQTRRRFLGASLQSKPSMHHHPWHLVSSPPQCSGCPLDSGKGSMERWKEDQFAKDKFDIL